MKKQSYFARCSDPIHLAIDSDRLEILIKEGSLSVADFSCLDLPSKNNVWAMLRSLAAKRLARS
jgi:hypothetical protein